MAPPRLRAHGRAPARAVPRSETPDAREDRVSDVAPISRAPDRGFGIGARPAPRAPSERTGSGERPILRLPQTGELLAGRYRVVRQLGRGGMSTVYEAFHARTEAQVAVKVLHPELIHADEAVRRFLRESRAISRVRSPHVVQVLDADTTDGGLPFTVMELLSGRDLGELWSGSTPITVREVCDYVRQACEGLSAAHAVGIVHRDVKPGNLFVCDEPGGARVKLIDFGVAKLAERCSTGLVTRHGETIGTPLYMAPEQIRAKPIDGRVDVWALGVVMYRVLTGRAPFSGKSDSQYLIAVLEQQPKLFAELRADLAPELGGVVMKALAKDPAARFGSAKELADALEPFARSVGRAAEIAAPARASAPAPARSSAPARATDRPPPRPLTTAAPPRPTLIAAAPRPPMVAAAPRPSPAELPRPAPVLVVDEESAPSTLREPTMPVASREVESVPAQSHRVVVDPAAEGSDTTLSSEPSVPVAAPISIPITMSDTPVMSSAPPRPIAMLPPPLPPVASAALLTPPPAAPSLHAPSFHPPASAPVPFEPTSRPLRSAMETVTAPRPAGGGRALVVAMILFALFVVVVMTGYALLRAGATPGRRAAADAEVVTPALCEGARIRTVLDA